MEFGLNLIVIIVVGLTIVIFSVNNFPKPELSNKTTEEENTKENQESQKEGSKSDELKNIEWKIYKNEKYDFEGKYPEGWSIDDSGKPSKWSPADSGSNDSSLQIVSSGEEAVVVVLITTDIRLTKEGGYELVINDLKNLRVTDPRTKLDRFEEFPSEHELLAGSFASLGSVTIDNKTYRCKEVVLLYKAGYIFARVGCIESDKTEQYGKIVNEIMNSFDPFGD